MYLVLVRATGPRAAPSDRADAFYRAVLGSASPADGVAHVYAMPADEGGVAAALFVLAPTVEQAEERARRVCLEAAAREGLALERCEVDLIVPLEEAALRFFDG